MKVWSVRVRDMARIGNLATTSGYGFLVSDLSVLLRRVPRSVCAE